VNSGNFSRWLYSGHRPGRIAHWANAASAWVYGLGFAPNYLVALEVTGRNSGRTIVMPLVVALADGQRYLVSMLGEDAQWVKNVRAAGGRATLKAGKRRPVRLEEVPVSMRAPIIKAYLQRAPGARPHLRVNKDAGLEAFEQIAASTPVFKVVAVPA
jgi:hypothetical protein